MTLPLRLWRFKRERLYVFPVVGPCIKHLPQPQKRVGTAVRPGPSGRIVLNEMHVYALRCFMVADHAVVLEITLFGSAVLMGQSAI